MRWFWARLGVQEGACVLNPLIVVPDPNLAAPCPDGIMAGRSSQPRKPRCMGTVRLVPWGVAPVRRVRATEETRRGGWVGGGGVGGLRPRDEWTPIPRYSEMLTANMLTTLRLRVKQRCRGSAGSRPKDRRPGSATDPGVFFFFLFVFFWVEFGLVRDGTGEASWRGDGRRLQPLRDRDL